MACLAAKLYDPASLATASTASLLAMTAFDTTNARVTFNAPSNGIVFVKLRVPWKGATTSPSVLLGVLDGATVRGRQVPLRPSRGIGSASLLQHEAAFLVAGLTPSNSYSFDAAYGVEVVTAATQFGWGGPNDAVASNAYGALSLEVWETANLLGGVNYDPAAAVSKSVSALLALTALDTTNLRLAFTAPASGQVAVRLRGVMHGATGNMATIHLGVLESSTVKMRQAVWSHTNQSGTIAATDQIPCEAFAVIGGLTPSASLTWDAAYAVEATGAAGMNLKYGGPDNATTNDAFGGFTFEIWEA
jgi:hypothetical protein